MLSDHASGTRLKLRGCCVVADFAPSPSGRGLGEGEASNRIHAVRRTRLRHQTLLPFDHFSLNLAFSRWEKE